VAIASATHGLAPPKGVVAMGEIGLAGELRRVRDLPQRLAEAARLGFEVAVVPREAHEPETGSHRMVDGLRVISEGTVWGALSTLRVTKADHPRLRPLD
jgi:DNA repair protein RadA/Sms